MGVEYPSHPIPAVAAAIIRAEAGTPCEALLIRRARPPSQGEWSLPGGVLELGETLEEGLKREVLEETGLTIEPVAVLAVLDHIVRDQTNGRRIRFHYVLVDSVCCVTGGVLRPATDALEACWVTRQVLEEGTACPLPEKTYRVVLKGFEHYENAPGLFTGDRV